MLITIKEHCCTTLNLENNNDNNKSVVVYKRKRRKVFNREGECSHSMNKLFSFKKITKLVVLNSERKKYKTTYSSNNSYILLKSGTSVVSTK